MASVMRIFGLILFAIAACHGDPTPAQPDAATMPDAPPPDVLVSYPACGEFAVTAVTVPAHVAGTLAGADLASPQTCGHVDAPFGIETAGPDSVMRFDGLTAGKTYVVDLSASADLSFYVVTGCGTQTGPSSDQCALFVDATNGGELGTFVAPAQTVFVVVDYYQASPPSNMAFTLDVYEKVCDDDAGLRCGSLAKPVCENFRCVECATSFDCITSARSRCEPSTNSCLPGIDTCASDDAAEPADDGPAGATVLALDGTGHGSVAGSICASPSSEADFIAFDVGSVGETWAFQLAWSGPRDIDLLVFDAAGTLLGESLWESPERVALTYLVPGRYFARVTEYATSTNASPLAYTVTATRTLGAGCTSTADCAAEYRNQIYRGDCEAGSCISLDGAGAVGEGGVCDSQADCLDGLACPSFFFVSGADTRETCNRTCTNDVQCGAGFVCTTYLTTNFCVPKCTDDDECPAIRGSKPQSGPWVRLGCEASTGRCLP